MASETSMPSATPNDTGKFTGIMKKQKKGKLLIFSAPSGSGKSTIIGWLMENHPELMVYFIYDKDGQNAVWYSPSLKEKIQQ